MDWITVGLDKGDECKGSMVDFLASKYGGNVVRYCGGSQCAHNVVSSGIHHTFSQFGSGTFVGLKTIISKFTLIDPIGILVEGEKLETKGISDPFEKLLISENSLVITPYQIICGKIKEILRTTKKGTCGRGVGETVIDERTNPAFSIRAKDLLRPDLEYKLKTLKMLKLDQIEQLASNEETKILLEEFEMYSPKGLAKIYLELTKRVGILSDEEIQKIIQTQNNIFEAAQGTILDCDYGFKPNITQTRTSIANALELLGEKEAVILGLLRPYSVRHGAGPFPTVDENLNLEETHNVYTPWQRFVRQGWLDFVLLRYSLQVNKRIDKLVVSCLDKMSGLKEIKFANSYRYIGKESEETLNKYFDFGPNNQIVGVKLQKQDEVMSKLLWNCQPVYTTLPGWEDDISNIKNYLDLPSKTRSLLEYIEGQLGVPIGLISVGPDRDQKISIDI